MEKKESPQKVAVIAVIAVIAVGSREFRVDTRQGAKMMAILQLQFL